MPYIIDVDTGGTFTDCFVSGDSLIEWLKVDTTPHDLTVGFRNAVDEAAKRLGLPDTRALLGRTEVIRLSTTIGTNALIQQAGPKLGLIVSRGFEDTAYSELGPQNPIFDFIILRNMVFGVKGKVDSSGNVTEPLDEDEIKDAVRELLGRGARVIVVSLENSSLNSALENQIKDMLLIDYPRHYLGSMPILLSTEISLTSDNASRTNAALLNAYIQREMRRFLYKTQEDLRNAGYIGPFMIVHNWGGASSLAKTKAISTYASGPAAGLFGAAFISKVYGVGNIVSFDVGGTSADFGLVLDGRCPVSAESKVDSIPLKLAGVQRTSVGAGGGSIAKATASRELRVGPESAGAMPGPACYDLGGTEPTVTDSCLVLGYINPNYFLGGRKRLNATKAFDTVSEKLAQPLGLKVEEAALNVIKEQASFCSANVAQLLRNKGLSGKEVVMLSFGGAGGIFCSQVADATGIAKIYVPPFAAAFSAFGSSTMDIAHEYEALLMLTLRSASGDYLRSFDALNQVVGRMQTDAERDVLGEGFPIETAAFSVEMELRSKEPSFTAWIPFPRLHFEKQEDIRLACDELGKLFLTAPLAGEIVLERLKLKVVCPIPHSELPTYSPAGKSPEAALKGKREVFWENGFVETRVYEQKLLQCGNEVLGPAIIEGEDSTILVPKGKKYSVDRYLFGVLEGG